MIKWGFLSMKVIKLRRGYDIKIVGDSERIIKLAPFPNTVALKSTDFEGMKPRLLIDVEYL